jgi:aspartyl-tRNA synthetase
VDKFYDQDDLSAWEDNGAKAGYDFILSGPADKTRTQLSALRMELATRLD